MANKQRMKQNTSIKVFSSISVLLGITSISLQVATLALTMKGIYNDDVDYIGAGIWAGAMYITAGGLGIAASIQRTKSLLIPTVVVAAISIVCSIAAATLSGINAGAGYYGCPYNNNGNSSGNSSNPRYSNETDNTSSINATPLSDINADDHGYFYTGSHSSYDWALCDAWLALEWTLMGFSIGAFINSIVLVSVASVPTCCQKQSKQQPLQSQSYQQVVMVNGQLMVLQPVVAGGPTAMGAQQAAPPQTVSYPSPLQPQQLIHSASIPHPSQQSSTVEVESGLH